MVTVDDALFKNYSIGPKKQAYRKVTDLPVKECHRRPESLMGQVFSSGSRETIYLHSGYWKASHQAIHPMGLTAQVFLVNGDGR